MGYCYVNEKLILIRHVPLIKQYYSTYMKILQQVIQDMRRPFNELRGIHENGGEKLY